MTMIYSNAASTMVHQHYDYLQDEHANDVELSNLLDDIFPEMSQLQQESMTTTPYTQEQNHFVPVSPSSSVVAYNKISMDGITVLQVTNFKPQDAVRVSPVPSNISKSRIVAKIPPSPSSSSSSRKRSISSVTETSVDPDKRQTVQRRERNREHAKRSRLRKKGITAQLQESAIQLKEENEKLRNIIYAKLDKAKIDAMVNEKITTPNDKFVKALHKPSNRVIDHDTLSFLQSLSASCQIGK